MPSSQDNRDPLEGESAYILDAENTAEMLRLINQDHLLTRALGGLLAQRPTFEGIQRVLDIACGPGGWAMEVAYAHPEIEVYGFDISNIMIQYAIDRAKAQGLNNAHFRVANALEPLNFDDNYFDLVNARLLISFMPRAEWPGLIQQCMRILRPGGFIRLTEIDDFCTTSSPAFEQFSRLSTNAGLKSGRAYIPHGRNAAITAMLAYLLRGAGFEHIKTTPHALDCSTGSELHESIYQDYKLIFKLMQPFLLKYTDVRQEELDELYEQVLLEMQQEDFCAIWYFLTAWAQKPLSGDLGDNDT
jgi:ubiquinone/menaquinone biosynthesis C-methylase UbiE